MLQIGASVCDAQRVAQANRSLTPRDSGLSVAAWDHSCLAAALAVCALTPREDCGQGRGTPRMGGTGARAGQLPFRWEESATGDPRLPRSPPCVRLKGSNAIARVCL